jgi:hypothetical protein
LKYNVIFESDLKSKRGAYYFFKFLAHPYLKDNFRDGRNF